MLPMGNATTLARSKLYGGFARGLGEQGLTVFRGGPGGGREMSQGLGISALFNFNPRTAGW